MKQLVFTVLLFIISIGFIKAQIPVKKNGLTKADRANWHKVLKWNDADAFQGEINRFENAGFTFYKLSNQKFLVQILVGAGAYQRAHAYAILDERNSKKPTAKLLKFTDYFFDENSKISKETSSVISGRPAFNQKAKTLQIFYKGSGLGYCGSLTTYKITSNKAQTIEARVRSCKDESAQNFPPPHKWEKVKLF